MITKGRYMIVVESNEAEEFVEEVEYVEMQLGASRYSQETVGFTDGKYRGLFLRQQEARRIFEEESPEEARAQVPSGGEEPVEPARAAKGNDHVFI